MVILTPAGVKIICDRPVVDGLKFGNLIKKAGNFPAFFFSK
jgi:hypothetical protein